MPKRFLRFRPEPASAQTESFEPYWTSILIIAMTTFALFGIQSITTAVQAAGPETVTTCFLESNKSPYHRFQTCTK